MKQPQLAGLLVAEGGRSGIPKTAYIFKFLTIDYSAKFGNWQYVSLD